MGPADWRSQIHIRLAAHAIDYLPRVIYIKFEGARWRIHPGLSPGVFPLRPVQRTWTLNEETSAKVSRKGFTLVPDYSSTGFMLQGATLPAEIADCGDIFCIPGLTEMLTSYVIMSRIRTACTLFLIRVFSRYLFKMGSPPGPACLLKVLKRRFGLETAASGEGPYTLMTEARVEYALKSAEFEHQKKLRKARGLEWPRKGTA